MSIMKVINEVCDVVSLDRFDSVYGSNDPDAQTMLEMAKIGGDQIAKRFDWKALQRSDVVVAEPSPFPADYGRLVEGGAVMSAVGDFFRPVKNPSQWAVVKRIPSAQPYFYLNATSIEFSPASDAVGSVVTYISKNWIVADGGEGKDEWSSDDDTTAFPENLMVLDLIWRWKRQKGLSYDDPLAEFEAALQQATGEDR